MVRIFLSSTARDLAEYRQAVYEIIDKVEGFECIGMEQFGAMPMPPLEACLQKVSECDIYIGIIGHLYGSCPPRSDKSYTWYEYERARELNKLRFVFKAPHDFNIPANLMEPENKQKKQITFRDTLSDTLYGRSFNSPDHLAASVLSSIANFYRLGSVAKAIEEKIVTYVVHGPGKIKSYEFELKNDRILPIAPNEMERHVVKVEVNFGREFESIIFDYSRGYLPPNTVFDRASTGLFRSSSNDFEVAELDEPRFEEIRPGVKALLIEPKRENHLLNSESPETQFVQLWEGAYTLSECGNGTATINPAGDNVSARMATEKNPLTFTVSATGSWHVRVQDKPDRFQLEDGLFATSPIPTSYCGVTRMNENVDQIVPIPRLLLQLSVSKSSDSAY